MLKVTPQAAVARCAAGRAASLPPPGPRATYSGILGIRAHLRRGMGPLLRRRLIQCGAHDLRLRLRRHHATVWGVGHIWLLLLRRLSGVGLLRVKRLLWWRSRLAIVHVERCGLGREHLLLASGRLRKKRLSLLASGRLRKRLSLLSRRRWAKGRLLLLIVQRMNWARLCGHGIRRRLITDGKGERTG